jgi:hypothetical protein
MGRPPSNPQFFVHSFLQPEDGLSEAKPIACEAALGFAALNPGYEDTIDEWGPARA